MSRFLEDFAEFIKNGFTSVIECNVEDYNDPEGYQIVLRQTESEAILIVHTFKNGAKPPIEKHLENWKVQKEFGSSLDGDFRSKCYYLRKN